MRRSRIAVCVVALCLLVSGKAMADSPIQLALWPSVQLVPEDQNIRGLRLQVYGRNADVTALDLGFVHETTGNFAGVQLGLVGMSAKDASGLQWNWFYSNADGNGLGWQSAVYSHTGGDFQGLQTGVVDITDGNTVGVQLSWIFNQTGKHISGAQLGLVNRAESVKGLQLGLVNLTDKMNGIQIGIWNQIDAKPDWKIIPIVNWNF